MLSQNHLRLLRLSSFLPLIILVAFCHTKKDTGENEVKARTPVTIISPVLKDLKETVEYPSVSAYLIKNSVRSSTTGIIESVGIAPGEYVTANSLLFTLKTKEAAALQSASSADTTLNFRGIIKIHSSNEGVVSSILHQAGDFVQEGDELAVISDSRSVVFVLEVPFEMKENADRNKECLLRLPDSSLIRGIIIRRLPEMNVQDQTVSYIVQPVSNRKLPQNLIATAVLVKTTIKSAQVLPKEALLGNETQTEFWIMKVINDSTAVKITVSKGIENKKEVEIKSPILMPGDRILKTGNYGLPDTAAITIEK
jgi:multidrug efflux pump subunit AcrA (membrane-fusion protein)